MRPSTPNPTARRLPIALLAGLALLASGCGGAPASLAEAILERPDEFPPGTDVVVPPSARSPLGHRKASDAGERRMSMEIDPCFIVDPVQSGGLSEITVAYESGGALQAELGLMLGKAGVDVGAQTRAVLTLRDLVVEEGIGVPDPNTCDFAEDTTVTVATRAIRAGTAELRFAGGAGTSGGVAASVGEIEGSAGWKIEDGERGVIAGRDIVLAAGLSPVEVKVAERAVDLGHAITGAISERLPGEMDGVLVVERYDVGAGADGLGLLTLRLEPTAAKARAVDGRCDPTASVVLGQARRCLARLGTAALAFWWELDGAPNDPRVTLKMRSYRMQAR